MNKNYRTVDFCLASIVVTIAAVFPIQLLAGQEDVISLDVAMAWDNPAGYERIFYGEGDFQFGELRIPSGPGPHPVAILIHGGGWKAGFHVSYFGKAANALTAMGIATWSLEYRRLGNEGAGWPGTFQDIANGSDYLRELARSYPLDLDRAIVIGHSAGGHLALWTGGRSKIEDDPALMSAIPIPLRGVLALAPGTDLADYHRTGKMGEGHLGDTIERLLGGSPEQFPRRYERTSIVEMLPLGIRQIVVFGEYDDWTDDRYGSKAEAAGDQITVIEAKDAGHFELVDPDSAVAWDIVVNATHELLGIAAESTSSTDMN